MKKVKLFWERRKNASCMIEEAYVTRQRMLVKCVEYVLGILSWKHKTNYRYSKDVQRVSKSKVRLSTGFMSLGCCKRVDRYLHDGLGLKVRYGSR